jgi:MFS transporter, DHA1 family, inner membrane transport protein
MTSEKLGIETVRTRKFHVWLLIGSGVLAAAQIGKGIISLPMIRIDLALGLDIAALIVATFATLGASLGIGAGVLVQRLGLRRALIGGMSAIAIGNVIGAAAPNEFVLLTARIVEGIGFFGAALAIPSMLNRIVAPNERDFVMAVWSAYMPFGIMSMLLFGPLLPMIGWRNLCIATNFSAHDNGTGHLRVQELPFRSD